MTVNLGSIYDFAPPAGPIAADDSGLPLNEILPIATQSASDTKKVLISIGVLILFVIVMVEVAGINKQWAVAVGLLMLSLVLINIAHNPTSGNWTQYPYIP